MMSRLRSRMDPRVLGSIAAAAAIFWLFLIVAKAVAAGSLHELDARILLSFRAADNPMIPFGPVWFRELVRDISGVGNPEVLCLLVLVAGGGLLLARQHRMAIFVLLANASGAFLTGLFKVSIGRLRPDLVPYAAPVFSASFPSAHAMVSAVVYLTLGALLAQQMARRRLKYYIMGMVSLLIILIGISRIYLGVHWPSDILAGWMAGTAWALGCWALWNATTPQQSSVPAARTLPPNGPAMKGRPFRARLRAAIHGLLRAYRSEHSFRAHVLAGLIVLAVLTLTHPEAIWWAIGALTVGLVLVAELLNTALEALSDHLHPERHPAIRTVKDVAAGGVLVASLVAVIVAIAFVLR